MYFDCVQEAGALKQGLNRYRVGVNKVVETVRERVGREKAGLEKPVAGEKDLACFEHVI